MEKKHSTSKPIFAVIGILAILLLMGGTALMMKHSAKIFNSTTESVTESNSKSDEGEDGEFPFPSPEDLRHL